MVSRLPCSVSACGGVCGRFEQPAQVGQRLRNRGSHVHRVVAEQQVIAAEHQALLGRVGGQFENAGSHARLARQGGPRRAREVFNASSNIVLLAACVAVVIGRS